MTLATKSEWQGWWAVFVLFLAYTLSFIDRSIISLLVEPMREDLRLSDIQISLLQGLAFTLFYTTMSIPIAIVADRGPRPLLIGAGMFVWSAMTAACGLATNFVQLFFARMGVGVGEATLGPAAYSLIADLFPEEKRGRAMAVFSSGVSLGAGLAFLFGGYVIEIVNSGALSVSILDRFASWQLVFILVGVPGMLGAFLLLTVPEPRGKSRVHAATSSDPLEPIIPFLKSHSFEITCLFSTFAISGLIFTALLSWGPTMLIRQFGISAPEAGRLIGIGLVVFGPLGAWAGGWLADKGKMHGRTDAPLLVGFSGIALMSISGISASYAPSATLAGILISTAMFFGSFAYPAGATAVQSLAPARLRARFAALYLFAVTLVAATLGPTIVALFTDLVLKDPARIGEALALTILTAAPIGLIASLAGARELSRRPPSGSV